jgi:hypothetical protein
LAEKIKIKEFYEVAPAVVIICRISHIGKKSLYVDTFCVASV